MEIEISDRGPGIADNLRDRVFDPFFTTKDGDGGLGLGLPISRRIVRSMGGTLSVESASGEGTTVGIAIPQPQVQVPDDDDRSRRSG